MKICLDPGHYGKYNSGIIKGYYESEMNLKLAYKLKEKLEQYGAEVFLTRTGTEDLSLYSRGQVAVKNNCDVFPIQQAQTKTLFGWSQRWFAQYHLWRKLKMEACASLFLKACVMISLRRIVWICKYIYYRRLFL